MAKSITSADQNLSELIGQIYQAATEPSCANSLAVTIAKAFNSKSGVVFFCRQSPDGEARIPSIVGFLSATDNTERARFNYASHFHERDEWHKREWQPVLPDNVLGQDMILAKDILRTIWSEDLHATSMLQLLGAHFVVAGDLLGVVGIHRPAGLVPFDEHDRKKLNLLCPHIQRALQLRESLALSEQRTVLTQGVLNKLDVGVVLLAADCHILFANRVAENALSDKCSSMVNNSRLMPIDSSEALKFEKLISEVAKTSCGRGNNSGGIFYLTLSSKVKLPVLVSPVKSVMEHSFSTNPSAMVVCANPHAIINITEQILVSRFELTHAEARLYSALISGHELAEYAEQQQVSVGTVKTHLKSIFYKTGCHRQADLVRIALSDPVLRI